MVLNNLADLYRAQSRYADAEPLYRRAIEITGKALGPRHPDLETMTGNLAKLYQAQERNAEAEELLQQLKKAQQKPAP